jgi:phage shock protein C
VYRLRKVTGKEKKIFGVIGGISKYIDPDIDPVGLRILWVIITIFAVIPMTILYLILAMVLKPEDYEIKKEEKLVKEKKEKIAEELAKKVEKVVKEAENQKESDD